MLLTRILARGAEQAATLTRRAEQEAHASVGRLWAEYETLANQAAQSPPPGTPERDPERAEQIKQTSVSW